MNRSGLLLLALAAALVLPGLAQRDLWSSHEARAAQDAQRMLTDQAWGVPRLFDDQFDLQKPPLYYWLVASCGWLAGGTVDALSVRLPAAGAALMLPLLLLFTLARHGRPTAGLFAALALLGMQHFVWLGRVGRIDQPLALAVGGGLLAWYAGGWMGYLLAALAWAAAVLLKGPIGIVLAGVALMAWCGREWRRAWTLPVCLGAAGLLAAPWFLYADEATNGAFTREFFGKHHLQRAFNPADETAPHADADYPWWYYLPVGLLATLPTAVLVPFAARAWWRQPADRWAQFGLTWAVAMVGFLSLCRFKRVDYLLPALAGLALWLGCVGETWWRQLSAGKQQRWQRIGMATLALYLVGWWVVVFAVLPQGESERERHTLARLIRTHAPAPELILFFRVEDHVLAWHLGRAQNTVREWENLAWWAGRPGPFWVVMPAATAAEWPAHLPAGSLREVTRAHGVVLLQTPREGRWPDPAPP
jgi:4-amino-4-deoxy-L-arabinose transferase-like glycosyltransferase